MARITGNKLDMQSNEKYGTFDSNQIDRYRTCSIIPNRSVVNTYGAEVAGADMMSKRSSTSAKKSASSVLMKKPVVARQRSPKTLSPFSRTGLEGGGVPEAYCPGSRCTPQDGMGKDR